ncbi:hypothetical protein [Candidatus Cytomitobacter primus]|uniref:Uncharacterized protein n=1 Tax=Candidatus Cytomitobacter primus TaxID=2066024 RepID=A0A5C0UEM2_9PROT|nr:hypothetical protein [Candidatus Cytomitobacter primus]QEK38546.1 hypothetical protein FZC34_01315 [Candidatus Cytomitobacter primus]
MQRLSFLILILCINNLDAVDTPTAIPIGARVQSDMHMQSSDKTDRELSYTDAQDEPIQEDPETPILQRSTQTEQSGQSQTVTPTPASAKSSVQFHTPTQPIPTPVSETPLQAFAKKQSNDLPDANEFIRIIGQDKFDQMVNRFNGGINGFNDLRNPYIAPDDQAKRFNFKGMSNYLNSLSRYNTKSTLFELNGKVNALKYEMDEIPEIWIKKHTEDYFSNLYKGCSVSFQEKKDGVQLGFKAIVSLQNADQIKYHVKSHAAGWAKNEMGSINSTAKPAEFDEVFIFHALSILGNNGSSIGPNDIHFYGRDIKNVCIATKDIDEFQTYDCIAKNNALQELVGKLVEELRTENRSINKNDDQFEPDAKKRKTADLFELTEIPFVNEKQVREIEEDIIARNFLYEMTKMDVINRIFSLRDVYNNTGNFGFVFKDDKCKLKIIDFRPSIHLNQDNYNAVVLKHGHESSEFDYFAIGNGIFQGSKDNIIQYAFKLRPVHLRIKDAKKILNEIFSDFDKKLDEIINKSTVQYRQLKTDKEAENHAINILDRSCRILKIIIKANYQSMLDGVNNDTITFKNNDINTNYLRDYCRDVE